MTVGESRKGCSSCKRPSPATGGLVPLWRRYGRSRAWHGGQLGYGTLELGPEGGLCAISRCTLAKCGCKWPPPKHPWKR